MKHKKMLKWKQVKDVKESYELIDEGVIVKWAELKTLSHHLPPADQVDMAQYLVKKICANTKDRLYCEVLVETLVLWLACVHKDEVIQATVQQFMNGTNAAEGVIKMVEISLTGEISDPSHQEAAFAAAVMLICSLAKTIEQKEREGEESFEGAQKIVPQITTYLLSVSNLNDYVIRLSLLHYFGYMAAGGKNHVEFERVLNRFGYTVLDYLFSLLFKKKSESIALQFLLENFTYFLEASASSQRIIHEILKYYLLKKPDRCSLFLQTLGDKLNETDSSLNARKAYLQHLGALLHVVGKINHKALTMDLLSSIYRCNHPFLVELSSQIQNEDTLDEDQKEFAKTLEEGSRQGSEPVSFLRSHRRGRHPSFHTSKPLQAFEQVAVLGNVGTLGRVS